MTFTHTPVPGNIITVVGTGTGGYNGDGGSRYAMFNNIEKCSLDSFGNLYIAEVTNSRIRKLDLKGNVTTVAGTTTSGFSGDGGRATDTMLWGPSDVKFDTSGNYYIADTYNQRIRKVDAGGFITTVAGNGTMGYAGDDEPALSARLNFPSGIALDSSGNIYIADTNNHRIRKVDTDGIITTVAGSGTDGFLGDGGAAVTAWLNYPSGVAVDASGNIYIADKYNNRLRKVDTDGIITTVAGNGSGNHCGDGSAAPSACLYRPSEVVVDTTGNIFIVDSSNARIRKVDMEGIITTVAGGGMATAENQPATSFGLTIPTGIALGVLGDFFIVDRGRQQIMKVDTSGYLTFAAGSGTAGYRESGLPALSAQLNGPNGVVVDSLGNLYISDTQNNRIRKVDTAGFITTVAGNGTPGFGGDGGPGGLASIYFPVGIAVDIAGNLYFADKYNHRIRKVDTSGIITTVAGDGTGGYGGDGGDATSAQIYFPDDVAVDPSGGFYISDTLNHRIRKVNASGFITTVAGTGTAGDTGDGGLATSALLIYPKGIASDSSGNLYIADQSHRIRMVDMSGYITTVAGDGTLGYSGDGGFATDAQVSSPDGIARSASGEIFIALSGYYRIRKVDAGGIISTVAGITTSGFSGDGGPATSAQLYFPKDVAVDSSGNFFIADTSNNRIRKVFR